MIIVMIVVAIIMIIVTTTSYDNSNGNRQRHIPSANTRRCAPEDAFTHDFEHGTQAALSNTAGVPESGVFRDVVFQVVGLLFSKPLTHVSFRCKVPTSSVR